MSTVSDKIKRLESLLSEIREEQLATNVASDVTPLNDTESEENKEIKIEQREGADRPETLEGLPYGAILVLEVDGELTREEKQWLNTRRNLPFGGLMPRLRID